MTTCPHCHTNFDLIDGFGSHCSRSCAVRHGNKKIWSNEELEHLTTLVGSSPIAKIIHDWNSIATEKGWILRSPNSIKIKATRLFRGKTVKAHNDNFSFSAIARKLNISIDRIQVWESLGLEVENYSQDAGGRSHIKCVSKKALTEFARLHPEQLWGIAKNVLEKFLTDKVLARALFKTVNQPTIGRSIAIVDLKHCAVYKSARDAATVLDLQKNTILHNAKIDPHPRARNLKHNFAQLDYPVWWITREHAPVMHEIAGEILYQMHGEYIEVEGYTKQRFLSLGVAIAVRIAIRSINLYQQQYNNIPDSKNGILKEIASRIRNLSESFQQRFLNRSSYQSLDIIKATIKNKARHIFQGRIADKRKVDLYLEEFTNEYIEWAVKFFKRRQYLPKNWQPRIAIEYAYYWDFIFGLIFLRTEVGKKTEEPKKVSVLVVSAYRFIQKRGLEFSSLEHNENYLSHQGLESNESLFESELADFIEANSENKHLQTILFAIAHGFSDQEIAAKLEISKQRYYEYKSQLQDLTAQFMQQAEVF